MVDQPMEQAPHHNDRDTRADGQSDTELANRKDIEIAALVRDRRILVG
jgi:hypothetical protein